MTDAGPALTLADTLDITGEFALALNDRFALNTPLAALRRKLRAESVSLVRWLKSERSGRVIARDGRRDPAAALAGALTELFDHAQDAPCAGDLCQLPPAHELDEGATLVLVLRNDRTEADLILLRHPSAGGIGDNIEALTTFAQAATKLWTRREAGLIGGLAVDLARADKPGIKTEQRARILGPDNPYRLSRAEFRVCALLRRGLRPADIARELGLAIATIRSHLRSIYAKTDLSGQREVILRLSVEDTLSGQLYGLSLSGGLGAAA